MESRGPVLRLLGLHREQVLAAYRSGQSLDELGALYDCSPGTVRRFLITCHEELRTKRSQTGIARLARSTPGRGNGEDHSGSVRPLCRECRLWKRLDRGQAIGECRRFAPHDAGWPTTGETDWCGEWEAAGFSPGRSTA